MPDPNVIEFECPRCLSNVRAPNDQAGQRIECPSCQGSLLVPTQSVSQDLFNDIFESESGTKSSLESIADAADDSQNMEADSDIFLVDESSDQEHETGEPISTSDNTIVLEEEIEAEPPLGDEDLLAGLDIPADASSTSPSNPLEGKNPFEVDPDAPIKVDGIGDLYSHADVYGIKCMVCDTRIHVRPDQIDTHIECPECFSRILVTPPTADKPTQRWVKEGHGRFTKTEDESDDELRLSAPVERPKIDDINLAYGLEPVTDDLLAPKPKSTELDAPLKPADEPKLPPLLEILDDEPVRQNRKTTETNLDSPALEDLDLDSELPSLEDLEVDPKPRSGSPSAAKPAPIANVASRQPASGSAKSKETARESARETAREKSRRELYEESQRRQQAAEVGTPFKFSDEEAEVKDYPEFDFGSLLNAVKTMLQSPGIIPRAAIAIVLMCLGTILMQSIWPSYVPTTAAGSEAEAPTFFDKLVQWLMWATVGGVPYFAGLGMLWFTAGYLFRDAALGQRQVLSWRNSGTAEIKATFLLFAFGFFIGGLPMPPVGIFMILILPMRFLLGSLFLVSAWHSQSAFSIVSVDAFKNLTKQMSLWTRYYVFVGVLAAGAFVIGVMFWMRYFIPFFPLTIIVSVIAVILMAVVTLAFAAVCGWHCGRVAEGLETSE